MKLFKLTPAGNTEKLQIPDTEFEVLITLHRLGTAHAPAISRATNGAVSVAAIYKLLSRLEKRGVVTKFETTVLVGDISVRRVVYQVDETINFQEKGIAHETLTQKAKSSAGRTDHPFVQDISASEAPA